MYMEGICRAVFCAVAYEKGHVQWKNTLKKNLNYDEELRSGTW